MVAHNLTDISLLSTVWRIRRSFLEANVPVVVSLIGPFVVPINKMQMKPRPVMAALIIRSQAKSFPRDGECTMLIHFPETLRAGWHEKSTDVCPVVRDGSGSPQWCGARWRRQGTISKGFINCTEIVLAARSPSCSIEITCYQVNLLRNHYGTKSLDGLLGNAFLLGVDVAHM